MKNSFKLLLILLVSVLIIAGCEKNPTASFKNPKEIEYNTDKGSIILTYDDNGNYEEETSGYYKILKNRKENFRIDMDYAKSTVKQQKTAMKNFDKLDRYTVIKDVKFGKYSGDVLIDDKYTTAILYLYFDKKNNIISYIKISPLRTNDAMKEIEKGSKAENVLYNKEEVQKILKTIKYVKK